MVVLVVAIVIVLAVFIIYPWIDDNIFAVNDISQATESTRKETQSKALPMETSVKNIITSFCEIVNEIDDAMPYANTKSSTSKICINGGNSSNGKGLLHCWYDKDYSGVDTVVSGSLHRTGLSFVDTNNGWYMTDSGWINYKCTNVSGYADIVQASIKNEESIKAKLTELVNELLMNHTVTSCTVNLQADNSISFSLYTN